MRDKIEQHQTDPEPFPYDGPGSHERLAPMVQDLIVLVDHLDGQGITPENNLVWEKLLRMQDQVKELLTEVEARADEFGGPPDLREMGFVQEAKNDAMGWGDEG